MKAHLILILTIFALSPVPGRASTSLPPKREPISVEKKPATDAKAVASASSLADLAEHLLPRVVNVSASSTVHPGADTGVPPGEDGPDAAPGNEPQVPEFTPGSPLDRYFRDYLQHKPAPDAPKQEMQAQGSGFIISPEGYIVTNEHVIRDSDRISVTLQDGTVLPARIMGRDHRTDLAVLKVNPPAPLPAVTFGDSDKARTGDHVVAIGNPFGLSGTVTSGIISSRSRDIHHGLYNDYIQTDAAINRGNSGGPMFNMSGDVIGINTAIFSTSGGSIGLGFAIPSNDAAPIVQQLIRDGHVTRGWIGVTVQEMTPELAKPLGLKAGRGGLITDVDRNGPSFRGGLKKGDAILEVDHQKVDRGTIARLIAAKRPGTHATLTFWRDGKEHRADIVIGLSPEKPDLPPVGTRLSGPKTISLADLGLNVAALDDDTRKSYDLGDMQRGVMVTSVAPNSISARRGLKAGDIVLQVQKIETDTPAAFAHEIDRARDQKRATILLLVQSKRGISWIPITLSPDLR